MRARMVTRQALADAEWLLRSRDLQIQEPECACAWRQAGDNVKLEVKQARAGAGAGAILHGLTAILGQNR